jgi:ribosomal protein S5
LLVGHGEGLFEDVRPAVEDAVSGSRRRMVPLYLDNLKGFVGLG